MFSKLVTAWICRDSCPTQYLHTEQVPVFQVEACPGNQQTSPWFFSRCREACRRLRCFVACCPCGAKDEKPASLWWYTRLLSAPRLSWLWLKGCLHCRRLAPESHMLQFIDLSETLVSLLLKLLINTSCLSLVVQWYDVLHFLET